MKQSIKDKIGFIVKSLPIKEEEVFFFVPIKKSESLADERRRDMRQTIKEKNASSL